VTATERVGLRRCTFPRADDAHVVLDLDHRIEIDHAFLAPTLFGPSHHVAYFYTITHDEVMTAGELRVVLGAKPNPAWAVAAAERPPSMTSSRRP
jgi:putative alpha-1,2-mannosidase